MICLEDTVLMLSISGFSNRYNTKPGVDSLSFNTLTSDMFTIEQSVNSLYPASTMVPALTFVNPDDGKGFVLK